MSDQIKIEELKMFLGTGLKLLVPDVGRCDLRALSEMGTVFVSGSDFGFDIAAKKFRPIVHPWSHLTREIEHNGERFVPMHELYGTGDGDIEDGNFTFKDVFPSQTAMDYADGSRVMTIQHHARLLSYNDATRLASWHFDCFNWLHRTDADGNPLAVEMEERLTI